jgi:hypothetical protein
MQRLRQQSIARGDMNVGRFLGLLTVFFLVMFILALSPLGDSLGRMIDARMMEAQAKQAQAQSELLEARNERFETLPLVLASVTDSLLSVAYAFGDRLILVAVIVYLLKERGKRHDNIPVSELR